MNVKSAARQTGYAAGFWGGAASGDQSSLGETADFSQNITQVPVHVRDCQATILHVIGIDYARFTYKYQGLGMKLTGLEKPRSSKRFVRDPG